jgi:hypothetical protein
VGCSSQIATLNRQNKRSLGCAISGACQSELCEEEEEEEKQIAKHLSGFQ